jgi:PAS domain S-box-containing protein
VCPLRPRGPSQFSSPSSLQTGPALILTPDRVLEDTFPGDSEMSAMMRAHPWSSTPLGPPETWPEALKAPLRMMLTSRFEMWLGWGEELFFFYNDAYVPTLGIKHPGALGRPTRTVWKEIFDGLKGRFDMVMKDGRATWDKALPLLLERSGYPEETYHTFSYSPLLGASGAVEGLMCVVSEETERVISERRLELLSALAASLLPCRTREAILAGARAALCSNTRDFPFSLARLFDSGPDGDNPDLEQTPWPFEAILLGRSSVRVPLDGLLEDPPKGAWDIAPREALIVPIVKGGADAPSGALVLGLNPYKPHDPEILGFAQLIAGQIAGSLATVDAQLSEAAEMDRLRQLFEQSPSFMAVLRGPRHRFELVNPRYLQLIGHREVVGKAAREAIPEVEGQGFFELLDKVYATGEPFVGQSIPITLQRTPGAAPEPRFLDFVYQPIRNPEGAVTGIFVEGIDVTSGHDAVIALRESEAQFRTLAEAMPNHVWTSPPDGQLDWFNTRTYQYCGAKPGELDGMGWTGMVHPEDLAVAGERWAAALAGGDTYETEFRLRRADGLYRWHLARAVPIRAEDGAIIRWIGTNTDIEDQKSTAEALAHLNATLESQVDERTRERDSLWSMSRDLFAVVGDDGLCRRVNPAWSTGFGHVADALARVRFIDFVHADDRAEVERMFQSLYAGAPVIQFEARIRAADGTYRTVSWAVVAAEEDYYASGRDVTEQRRMEEALRQSQKMEAVGQLTGGIAHDFNNLLAGITGSLQILETRIAQGRMDALARYIDAAQGAAKRAAALTQRLLAFSRRQTLDPRPVNLNRLIGDMEELIRRTVGPSVEMEVVGAGGVWSTLVDSNQLENALLNLCINARDAMPDGGRITIETANKWLDDRAAAERELPAGQYVSLCVTDTGTGMTPEVIARAFDPFFTTKPLGEGTGLGLSMIYGFVRQSGGQVRIYSELGVGTTMGLYLPRYSGEVEDSAPAHAVHAAYGGHGETVLIVDDEAVIRMLIVDVLESAGYTAIEAGDGAAGLRILESGARVDLLITDVGLPGGLNGRQVADAGRVLRPGLKVLFITGYAENAVIANGCLDPGMQVITKPFAIDALGEKIRQMIDG